MSIYPFNTSIDQKPIHLESDHELCIMEHRWEKQQVNNAKY